VPGKRPPEGWDRPSPRTGAPEGIDRGWAYAPGASVAETVAQLARRIAALPPEIGGELGASAPAAIDRAWADWVPRALAGDMTEAQLAGVLGREVVEALEARGRAPSTADIMVPPSLLSGPKARRHETAGDALSTEDWLALSQRLRVPSAVLLDERSGALLILLAGSERVPQLAVRLDYATGKRTPGGVTNMVVSAYRPKVADILGRVAGGLLSLLLGAVG
jgi:hypothetical protein